MPREKIYISLDTDFKEFLEHQKKYTGTPISRMVELAAMKMYSVQFEQFLKQKKESE